MYKHINLAADEPPLKRIKKAFKKATTYLHKKGSFSSEDMQHKEVKPLIEETYTIIQSAVNKGISTDVPSALLQKLQSDVFVFSGMKTYTQLKEASLLLLDENKQIKPYHQFEQDILKIDNTYNRNYLQAEYQHATSAAQSASQWNDYMQDGNRYNLQIRTAGDDRVRESHAVLNGITLPAQHEFWKTHWTPFDWRCRCNIVQVLKDDYNESDIGIAHAAAQQAIPEMFRYNPGREGVIFPKKHPYYPQHCNGAKLNLTGLVGFANWLLDAENDRCKAMSVIKILRKDEMPKYAFDEKQRRRVYKLPFEQQFHTYELPNGDIVKAHKFFYQGEDFNDIINACTHFTKMGKTPYILPVIHNNPIARAKVFKGMGKFKYSPDLWIKEDNELWEVESSNTKLERTIKQRVSHAVKQADNIYFVMHDKTLIQYAEERLRARAKKYVLK